jgi:hypothetical protein
MRRSAAVVLAFVFLLARFAPVAAHGNHAPPQGPGLWWDKDHPRFRQVEYAATALVGGGAIAMYYLLPPQRQPRFIGGVLFDEAVRNALRVRSPSALQTAWALSDAVDVALVALVFGIDSLA